MMTEPINYSVFFTHTVFPCYARPKFALAVFPPTRFSWNPAESPVLPPPLVNENVVECLCEGVVSVSENFFSL